MQISVLNLNYYVVTKQWKQKRVKQKRIISLTTNIQTYKYSTNTVI